MTTIDEMIVCTALMPWLTDKLCSSNDDFQMQFNNKPFWWRSAGIDDMLVAPSSVNQVFVPSGKESKML